MRLPITTYKRNYYFHKFYFLFMCTGFIGSSLYGLLFPEHYTVTINGQVVETNFQNLLPFFIIGTVFLLIFIWVTTIYYRIKMDEEGITVLKIGRRIQYRWTDLKYIKPVALWNGSMFKVKVRNGKRFYFYADKPEVSFLGMFNGKWRTRMSEYVELKKKELGI